MPGLVRAYASVSPWNIRTLALGDYARLVRALDDEAKALKAESTAEE